MRHVSRFNPRATQVLTPTDGGKLAVASGQKSSSSKNSCSTSCCTQCHFDIEPFLGMPGACLTLGASDRVVPMSATHRPRVASRPAPPPAVRPLSLHWTRQEWDAKNL